jgi:uncharacterized protein with FMN-binding domain
MKSAGRIACCVGLSCLALLALSCSNAPAAKWLDGAYQGTAPGMHGDIALTVTVAQGKLATVTIDKQEETVGVADLALTRVPADIVKKQSASVDAVAGASVSSKAIMAAVENALTKAVKQ